ncbi:dipeptide ABC transporter ATP-binding protein [Streptomyces abyssomicinicus]|uniref:dipeptide ABC transporter ATP-binding protein n=1 Tax=Streptomyces abyssomicinicus TaxID=574929 RepID=UPI00124F8C53|nr:ABC transporter ATP-binding protein [Streptomyces abyssomicinicus]
MANTDATARRRLLTVEDLRVAFPTRHGTTDAVRGVSLTVDAGECLAVVGESGSGKSVTARALLGLAGPGARVRAGRMSLHDPDLDLTEVRGRGWRDVRGRRIGLVLQDALTSLDPLRTVGAEVAEALRNHRVVPRSRLAERSLSLLEEARVPEPGLRARQYPHQLSGGLRQRALIATALAAAPPLLIADEPTTALDVTVQARILDLLAARKEAGTGVLLISHDLSVVARLADRIAVMRHGEIVEEGPAARLLHAPSHPYTRRLLEAAARHTGHTSASGGRDLAAAADEAGAGAAERPVLEVSGVGKSFTGPDGRARPAVRDVSFTLHAGETLGIVGESGSGKTTSAQLALGLLAPDTGSVRLLGQPWSQRPERERRPLRRRIQLVQQDPLGSFDPRYTVERIIGEALPPSGGAPGRGSARERRARLVELLTLVGLEEEMLDRRPRQMSGGQRQRVAVARALAPGPDVIVCDEPVSALDVSVQAQILDLFADLRRRLGVALLFISHDLGVVHHISDRVLVMRDGEVVESGAVGDVFRRPAHPYTRELLAALPRSSPPPAEALAAAGTTAGPTAHAGETAAPVARTAHAVGPATALVAPAARAGDGPADAAGSTADVAEGPASAVDRPAATP